MKLKTYLVVVTGLLLLGLLLVGCGATPEPCPDCPTAEPCPECPECPEPVECPEVECPDVPAGITEVPFAEMWAESPHADEEAEAFRHWDEDDPQEIPPSCAACHSSPGYQDYLGADGSEMWVVDQAAPVGTVVDCAACHNEATAMLDTIPFPSGVTITIEGPEARCAVCHQGRASTASVDNAIAEAGLEDMDTTSEELGFTNIHYFAAAATMYGTLADGGYQYEGKAYDAKFDHVQEFNACVECHSPHTLELQLDSCAECHTDVGSVEDIRDVRMAGSLVDYDGDGNTEEGIYYEIETMQEKLYATMQAYASEVAETPIVYDTQSYPYFFVDTNENGEADEDEANYGNRYASWTGRLAKAAYNYQTSLKDPGAYAHGGKYIIQLLYDSIEDLNATLASPIDMTGMHRIDHGHFAGSEEAFRHWDEDGAVSASCATCHSAAGLPFLLEHGVQIEQPIANGFECATCHDSQPEFTLYEVTEVEFPSGATVAFEATANNLCLECHQGRESTASVDRRIGDAEEDTVVEGLGFANVHYFAAGATLFGGEAMGGYQYEGMEYVGRNEHVSGYDTCSGCHNAHALEVKVDECSACHGDFEDVADIRIDDTDYDGDGDTSEGIAGEIETLTEALYGAIQAYAADTEGTDAIVYDSHSYPYFFVDTNGDGEATPDEVNFGNRYGTWTPALLRAAYNYQYAQKDPGGFAHNPQYVIQLLYDAIEHVGGDVGGMTRP